MELNDQLLKIRTELFYGSSNYTKNQPDLFVPHKFKMLAPSQVDSFVEQLQDDLSERDILLYLHFPFCFSECLFCNSFPLKVDKKVQQEYLEHLIQEIELFSQHGTFEGKRVQCVFFGGGTPTSFANSDLKRVIDKLRDSVVFADDCNITTEAHPQTLNSETRIAELAAIGFNRISIGCQTFDPEILARCNRNNTREQIHTIVKQAQRHGISINVDMMTGLPGQTLDSVQKDLDFLAEIRPDAIEYIRHEIVNPLVAELYKDDPELFIADEDLFEMVYMTQAWMETHGYEQNGRFTNDAQWAYRYHWLHEMPIIAFGPRTRSYTRGLCYDKHEDLATYAKLVDKGVSPIGRYMELSASEQMYRSLILGLQLKRGLDIQAFIATYDQVPGRIFEKLFASLTELGCIEISDSAIRLTRYGAYFVEDVCDYIIDAALHEEPGDFVRKPHSAGTRYKSLV